MSIFNNIKELLDSEYPDIMISEDDRIFSLYYSECDSYSECLTNLNNESIILSDRDYLYVANFLKELNSITPIRVLFSNKELNFDAFKTHYALIKSLLNDIRIEYYEGTENICHDKLLVFIDIISTPRIQADRVLSAYYNNSVFFSFIMEKEIKCEESNSILFQRHNSFFKENTKEWPRLSCDLPYKNLYDYVPLKNKSIGESVVREGERQLLYSFKDGILDFGDASLLNIVATEIEDLLIQVFESDNLPFLTFLCIPPYKFQLYNSRFRLLSERVCKKLNLFNGSQCISFDDAGEYSLNSPKIKGRNIILFDDILTTGWNATRFKKELESKGANVLCLICISKTVLSADR